MIEILLAVQLATPSFPQGFWEAEQAFLRGELGRAESVLVSLKGEARRQGYEREWRFRMLELQLHKGEFKRLQKDARKLAKQARGTYLEAPARVLTALASFFLGDTTTIRKEILHLQDTPAFQDFWGISFMEGLRAYLAGDLEQAKSSLLEVPTPLGQFLLARVYTELRIPAEALAILQKVKAQTESQELKALADYSMIETLLMYGDADGALMKARNFLVVHPGHPLTPMATFLKGVAQFQLKRYQDAYTTLNPLAGDSTFPLYAYASYFAGVARLMDKGDSLAVTLLERARRQGDDALLSTMAVVQLARQAMEQKDTARTISYVSQLPSLFASIGDGETGLYLAAVTSRELGEYDQSARYADELLKNGRKDHPLMGPGAALLLEAMLRSQPGEVATATGRIYQKLVTDQAPLWNAYYMFALGEALYSVGSVFQAETLYRNVLDQEPPDPRLMGLARTGLAWCYLHEKRDVQAKRLFHEVTRVAEDTLILVQALYGLGVAHFNLQEYDSAFQSFAAVVQLRPQDPEVTPEVLYNQGLAAFALKYYGDAVAAWEKVVREFPKASKAPEAAFRAADLYARAGKSEQALALLNWLIESHPRSPRTPEALLKIGQVYYNKGEYRSALSAYEKFMQFYPNHPLKPTVEQAMQQAYYALSQQDPKAVQEFAQRFTTSDLAASALFDRASQLYREGKKEESAETFLQVALDFPKSDLAPKALMNAAQIYTALEKWEDAAAAYEKYLAFYQEKRAQALFGLGTVRVQMGAYPQAIEVLELFREEFPDHELLPDALKNLAVAYLKAGRTRDGILTLLDAARGYASKGAMEEASQLLTYAESVAPDEDLRHQVQQARARIQGGSP